MNDPTFADFGGRDPRTLKMLYPERRWISASEIKSWAYDLWSDNAPRNRCCVCGIITVVEEHGHPLVPVRPGEYAASDPSNPCECYAPWNPLYGDDDESIPPRSIEECCAFIEEFGDATFAKAV